MNFLMLARVAKLVALLGFFLPWVVASCTGTEVLEATGLQMMTGDARPLNLSEDDARTLTNGIGPSMPAIIAFGAILIGLVMSFAGRQIAAAAILVGAVAGIGFSYYAVDRYGPELSRAIEQQNNQNEQGPQTFEQALSQIADGSTPQRPSDSPSVPIQIEEKEGYWLTLGALGAAILLALLTLGAAAPARAPRQEAPPQA